MTDGGTEDVWRREVPHVLAALQRRGVALEDCEDAVQETLLAAAVQWPREGMPTNPRGWLIRVASRRLIDAQRSDAARPRRELQTEQDRTATWSQRVDDHDDSLQMLVLCCHPALTTASAVALTLRAVGGLTTRQIAAGLLVPESTAAQRVSRAKATLRSAGARFEPVPPEQLPARLHAVRHVLHLIFTTGSSLPSGSTVIDRTLTDDAIRITERLHRAVPRDPETAGLLALMLLVDARAATRVNDGRLVPLAEQDRAAWDAAQIDRAVLLLEEALPRGRVGPFQLQAAIAAVHATAAAFADTDWPQILELYRMLLTVAPSAAVELGAAIALSEVEGPEAGLAALEPLAAARPRDHRVIAARAHMLETLARPEAAVAFRQAAALTDSIPEQNYLNVKAGHA
ncbi:sigma-70 family RNA polymerase sigma factor [Nocardioides sp. KIGAM211]|uniref:Sigma-70 family RNA polymerase sigma factor n=1 Tax=Nocardioides luti TaxID=2761101 RepID=A0A7X0RK06_9ACTN|nr:sigma-70 family RNA polymerase sigma factor [Nocardioides luti]